MDLIINLIEFFGLDTLSTDPTVTEFFVWFVEVGLAFSLIIIIFTFFFKAVKDVMNVSVR